MLTPRPRRAVTGGGAAVQAPAARLPRTRTIAEVSARSDALALKVGTKATASALLLACVVVILIGAQSLLATMEVMDAELKEMNEQLAIANVGTKILNESLASVTPTAAHLEEIVGTVEATSAEVKTSSQEIGAMVTVTDGLDSQLGSIATSTSSMSRSSTT